mgnify:CR=1 FL=1
MQEEADDQRRQRQPQTQQQATYTTNINTNEFQHLTAANIGMSLPSASSVASSSGAGVSVSVGGHLNASEPGSAQGGSSLLPEHAFHHSYNAFAAYNGNNEYQGGYSSNSHEEGVNEILQYAHSDEGNGPSEQSEYSPPENQN